MRRRTPTLLAALVVLLVAVLVAEGAYLWGQGEPEATAARPVVIGDVAAQAALQAASQDTVDIFSSGWRDYDARVERATRSMTPEFAATYRRTATSMRAKVRSERSETATRVVGASVVRASEDRVIALLFLNQVTTRRHGATSYASYRALVAMQSSDHGWLVAGVRTR